MVNLRTLELPAVSLTPSGNLAGIRQSLNLLHLDLKISRYLGNVQHVFEHLAISLKNRAFHDVQLRGCDIAVNDRRRHQDKQLVGDDVPPDPSGNDHVVPADISFELGMLPYCQHAAKFQRSLKMGV